MKKLVNVFLVVSAIFMATACCCLPTSGFATDNPASTQVAERTVTNTHAVAIAY